MLKLRKLFWKCIYTFNRVILCRFFSGIIIGNSYLYTESDEYVKLTSEGWIIIKSKTHKNCTDILPMYLVSEECIKALILSSTFGAYK